MDWGILAQDGGGVNGIPLPEGMKFLIWNFVKKLPAFRPMALKPLPAALGSWLFPKRVIIDERFPVIYHGIYHGEDSQALPKRTQSGGATAG